MFISVYHFLARVVTEKTADTVDTATILVNA